MNNVNDAAEVLRQRQRWTRRWYLLVIVLLYIGLLASFSLNVSLLLRKPAASVTRTVTSEDGSADSNSATAASGYCLKKEIATFDLNDSFASENVKLF